MAAGCYGASKKQKLDNNSAPLINTNHNNMNGAMYNGINGINEYFEMSLQHPNFGVVSSPTVTIADSGVEMNADRSIDSPNRALPLLGLSVI